MTEIHDRLRWEKKCLLNTRHDQPYRSGGHIITLNNLWNDNPDLRDECKEDWIAIIEWCREDPFCNDDKYFPEWKAWQAFYAES